MSFRVLGIGEVLWGLLPSGCVCLAVCLGSGATGSPAAEPRPDIVIADFEGPTYGDWKVEGEAFGPGPAQGTLPHQKRVSGFQGKGLVNSYYQGDKSTGKLTSTEFQISRTYISFLIGGGGFAGKTCMNLLVGGKAVRTATGPNTVSGGSEALAPTSWDVSELAGKQARIEIVDQATGSWGHINVDQIVLTDKRPQTLLADQTRQLVLEKRFLLLPIKVGGPKHKLCVLLDGQLVCDYDIEPADAEPDYWFPLDVAPWRGKKVALRLDQVGETSGFLTLIREAEAAPEDKNLRHEAYRPQFHFSPSTGWTNDPNGLVYYRGEYHLFFQHNPVSTKWGNMTWGHAVSADLVHWTELDDAIRPDHLGTIFSGSAVVDWNNTAGFRQGEEKPLVSIYTCAGGTSLLSQGQPFTQAIAYSNDRGRSWTKYEKNPVLANVSGRNRDPKVIWHEPTQRWIMVLYLDQNDFGFFSSPDLKTWTPLQTLMAADCRECPDFFEIGVEGETTRKWVFTNANDRYLIGDFDGRKFTPDGATASPGNWGKGYYAVQTYSDVPVRDGRRIQIGWMQGGQYPKMPFNQQMSFPGELKLRRLPEGLRLCRTPVKEIELLHGKKHEWKGLTLRPGENPLGDISGELFDIRLSIEPAGADEVGFTIRGQKIAWSAKDKRLSCLDKSAPLELHGGRIKLQILVDRTSLEVFANEGQVPMTGCFVPPADDKTLALRSVGGPANVVALEVFELGSAWPAAQSAGTQAEGELLYNGIRLPTEWPPRLKKKDEATARAPRPVPYLERPPAVIPIDVGRQLFVDDFLIEKTDLVRAFHRPQRYAKNPILKPETPLEMNEGRMPCATVFQDGVWFDPQDRLFKIWYHAGWFDGTAYAVSKDGLAWQRPQLDVVPGSNRVMAKEHHGTRDGCAVWLDHFTTDPQQRFKMFLYERPEEKYGGQVFTSPDGIHWLGPTRTSRVGDNTTILYNPFRKKWVYSVRNTFFGRARAYRECDDFVEGAKWTDNELVQWAWADDLDLPDPEIGDRTQLYNLDAVAYESLMLGVLAVHRGPSNEVCAKLKRPKITDLTLAYSRDGFHWHRPDREAFLAATRKEGDWDRAYLHSAATVCTIVGDRLCFYYGGWSGVSPALGSHTYAGGATGVAFLRRDGFASMDARGQTGTLTTRPVTFKGKHLFVNLAVPQGELRVEVLDANGKRVAPFSRENCVPITTDSTRQRIEWKGLPDLGALAGKTMRFRFHLTNGELYAFWVSPDATGASYGYLAAGGPGLTGPIDTVGRRADKP